MVTILKLPARIRSVPVPWSPGWGQSHPNLPNAPARQPEERGVAFRACRVSSCRCHTREPEDARPAGKGRCSLRGVTAGCSQADDAGRGRPPTRRGWRGEGGRRREDRGWGSGRRGPGYSLSQDSRLSPSASAILQPPGPALGPQASRDSARASGPGAGPAWGPERAEGCGPRARRTVSGTAGARMSSCFLLAGSLRRDAHA